MKMLLLRMLYVASLHIGLIGLFYFLNRKKLRVLTYHNVLPDALFDDSVHLGVSHAAFAFEKQMKIISEKKRRGLISCMITFDDGYLNQYEVAAPIVEKYGLTGGFFVTVELVRLRQILWPDRLMVWVSYVPPGRYELGEIVIKIDDEESRRAAWASLWGVIVLNYRVIGRIADGMNAAHPFERLPISADMLRLRLDPISAREIGLLASRGHWIGCHSLRHDILSKLSDDEIRREFECCEREIGDLFNSEWYSYPFGGEEAVTAREKEACRASRFRRAFVNVEDDGDDFAVPRISLPNTSDRYLIEAKLSGFERAVKRVLKRCGIS